MQGARPDLVLSGVNRGNNAAENVLYSGTIGGAMEAALQGLPAIALSQFMGPETARAGSTRSRRPAPTAPRIVRALLDTGPWDSGDYRLFYNVNFPPDRGRRRQGHSGRGPGLPRATPSSASSPISRPRGGKFLWIKGGPQHTPTAPGTDVAVNLDGYISVTPMRADLTAHDRLDRARGRRLG